MLFRWRDKSQEPEVTAAKDLRDFLTQDQPHRWKFIGVAIAIPAIWVLGLYKDSYFRPGYKQPEIVYITSWKKDRSAAEMKRDQKIWNEQERVEREAENARKAQERAYFRQLAKVSGIEVDEPKPASK